ncbi:hypothetical protein GH714_030918 [Hevea brasiliensis]|uniref:B-like cyclin n=1 Tax=Hevea brasiliensis TaxID=3981 RepID=A0A6A6KJV1_HEVBR|nr:hypothetical protein GH714_030918 [Hevea brasiliensis]
MTRVGSSQLQKENSPLFLFSISYFSPDSGSFREREKERERFGSCRSLIRIRETQGIQEITSEMASRPIVPQPARGEALIGVNMHRKKNAAGADGRNRRALGDIGNVVTVRGIDAAKPQAQISRPMTRKFCAQLLANAQAAAAAENNKKLVCVKVETVPGAGPNGAAAGKNGGAVKEAQKKVVVKPEPQEVIEISPDNEKEEEKVKKQDKAVHKKKESPRKKVQTLTSALTARSKAACGLGNKPMEEIVDIDAADANNDLAGVEYVEDIYKFYKLVENESRPHNYMDSQPEINEKMRAILIDWLIDVHQKFELSPETLYLTINIIDRFLSVKPVPRRELQLVGISATLMASKYEEIWPPEVNDLVCISDKAYTHEQIENMVYFLAELGIMHYDTIMFCPSMVAASAVYAARCTLSKCPVWTETLKLHTGFSESQLKDCAGLLVYLHSKAAENKLQTVHKKSFRLFSFTMGSKDLADNASIFLESHLYCQTFLLACLLNFNYAPFILDVQQGDTLDDNNDGSSSQLQPQFILAEMKLLKLSSMEWDHFAKIIDENGDLKGKCGYCEAVDPRKTSVKR